jgi:hypothetical protein
METIRSPKRRVELDLHGTKSQKATVSGAVTSFIDNAVFLSYACHPLLRSLHSCFPECL